DRGTSQQWIGEERLERAPRDALFPAAQRLERCEPCARLSRGQDLRERVRRELAGFIAGEVRSAEALGGGDDDVRVWIGETLRERTHAGKRWRAGQHLHRELATI